MARTVTPTGSTKSPANGRRRAASSGPTSPDPAPAPGRTRKSATGKTAAAPPAPRATRDALREQVETLERTVGRLQVRGRDAARAAKEAAARIDELEARLAAMEDRASRPAAAPSRAATRGSKRDAARDAAPDDAEPPRSRRGGRRDPGDAVPPGVAVKEPGPMDGEAAAAFESLEDRLRPAEG